MDKGLSEILLSARALPGPGLCRGNKHLALATALRRLVGASQELEALRDARAAPLGRMLLGTAAQTESSLVHKAVRI